jgi:hypothetical protein
VAKRAHNRRRMTAAEWATELQQRERDTRADLSTFISDVMAVADDIAAGIDVTTDAGRAEHDLIIHHRDHLAREAARLADNLGDHQHAHVREHRLFMLWQALGSVSVIANRYTERIERRLKVDRMVKGKRAKSATIDERIAAADKRIRCEHPKWTRWRRAGEIGERLPGLALKRRAIYRRLKK